MAWNRSKPDPVPDSGRNGYRTEHDPRDERPLLVWRQFWENDAEREAYERAVREIRPEAHWSAHQPVEGEDSKAVSGVVWMGMAALLGEISKLATGMLPTREYAMPRRMSQREWQCRQWAVKQAGGLRMDVDEAGGEP